MTQRQRLKVKKQDLPETWGPEESSDLYGVHRWGQGIFDVSKRGHLCLRGTGDNPDIDLKDLVDEIRLRGMKPPVLIRFTDILQRRMAGLADAFGKAMETHGFTGAYRGVYPVKVNQHRHVLEDITHHGRPHDFGLEVGSKAELLVAMALHNNPEALIVCNGFKDPDYIRTALSARQIGCRIFIVIEKPHELSAVLHEAKAMGVDPLLGVRMKLSTQGQGLWKSSGGDRSKFGLRASEILEAIRLLKKRRRLDCLQFLHFHVGSQIPDIQRIRNALREATAFYRELRRLGAPVTHLDVGGGLAVDYDGSRTNFDSSSNYSLQEYADCIVGGVKSVCEEHDLPDPVIVSEAGRALVAHHSVLVVEALAASGLGQAADLPKVPRKAAPAVHAMGKALDDFAGKNFQSTFHTALELRQEALVLFGLQQITLEERAAAEEIFWEICRRIRDYIRNLDYVPDELEGLERMLSTTYYCNFSLFQSLPDHWAIKQLFPIVPLHRLDERPTARGILADITCDSDGVIDRFVDLWDVRDTLPLHPLRRGEPYYLGAFLVGAYQEVLGDLHNLFGDTNVVHVSSGPDGYVIDKTVEGDSIVDALAYVQYNRRDLLARLREHVEMALRRGPIGLGHTAPFMRRVEASLDDYTYLQVADERGRRTDTV